MPARSCSGSSPARSGRSVGASGVGPAAEQSPLGCSAQLRGPPQPRVCSLCPGLDWRLIRQQGTDHERETSDDDDVHPDSDTVGALP